MHDEDCQDREWHTSPSGILEKSFTLESGPWAGFEHLLCLGHVWLQPLGVPCRSVKVLTTSSCQVRDPIFQGDWTLQPKTLECIKK